MLNKPKTNITYIGGGSRAWARALMSDLAAQDLFEGTINLYDIDYSAANDNQIIGTKLNGHNQAKSKWTYQVKDNLKDALVGAKFVIISILPGGFEEMMVDVHTPEKYGILQPVGDSTGPGGMIRAMRMFPMYQVIAEAIREYAPEAWVINYTNPMMLCTQILFSSFSQIKAIGCCHEVFNTQKLLCEALEDIEGIKGLSRKDIYTEVCGINHFTWITNASYQGQCLKDVYKKFVDKYYESGYNSKASVDEYKKNYFASANRVKMDLYLKFGHIAAAGDRHLAEFCPQAWYLKDYETIDKWKFALTAVNKRIKARHSLINTTKEYVNGKKDFNIYDTGEEGMDIIAALMGLKDYKTNVNYINKGQYTQAPLGSVVETNIKITKDNLDCSESVGLTDPINSIIIKEIYNNLALINAWQNKSIEEARLAFVNSTALAGLSLDDGCALFEEMTQKTKGYLQSWGY